MVMIAKDTYSSLSDDLDGSASTHVPHVGQIIQLQRTENSGKSAYSIPSRPVGLK
jgi:hypothetical protein